MTLLITLLFLASISLFIYSFFAKDYQSEITSQVSNVNINLMNEIIELKDRVKNLEKGSKIRG
ncbi:hypothetical protein [Calidifontibacillus oryziterrae]|uniref:hypothetical protein n=1 Tax=Calidifontibacillus oryziterrae TaxID=1191699 RepID=UPI000312FEE2|nr:hypothetical protein [Calidifontibacillus oryziterrae]